MKAKKNSALYTAYECKVERVRECPLPRRLRLVDNPNHAADYWRTCIVQHPAFSSETEFLVAVMLNTRRRATGHYMISSGVLDTVLVHPREVFRVAVMTGAAALILMHNHPSGDPRPSYADIKVTGELIRAGQLLKVDLLDHVIIGAGRRRVSLREYGYFDDTKPAPERKVAAFTGPVISGRIEWN